jgi:hypothetical protein
MLDNATSDDMIKIIDHMKDIITPIGIEVYNVYYKQMLIMGIFETIIDVLIIIGVPIGIYYLVKHQDKVKCFYEWIDDHNLEAYLGVFCIIVTIVFGLLFISAVDGLPDDIMHILNPDYYIIQNLLHG